MKKITLEVEGQKNVYIIIQGSWWQSATYPTVMCVRSFIVLFLKKHFSRLPFAQKQTSSQRERAVKGNSFAGGNFSVYTHIFFWNHDEKPAKKVSGELWDWRVRTPTWFWALAPGLARLCSRNKGWTMQELTAFASFWPVLRLCRCSLNPDTALLSKTPWKGYSTSLKF